MNEFQPSEQSFATAEEAEEYGFVPLPALGGIAAGAAAIIALWAFVPLFVAPTLIKMVKPEWSYGKRVAVGYAGSFAFNTAKNYVEDD